MENSSLTSKNVLPVDSHTELSFLNEADSQGTIVSTPAVNLEDLGESLESILSEAGFQGNTLSTPILSSSHLAQSLELTPFSNVDELHQQSRVNVTKLLSEGEYQLCESNAQDKFFKTCFEVAYKKTKFFY
jgi:hypothetical protein